MPFLVVLHKTSHGLEKERKHNVLEHLLFSQ